MKIKRLTLNGITTEVKFEGSLCNKWLVKNFSENDIFVSTNEALNSSESVRIKSNTGQVIVTNEYLEETDVFRTDKIYILGNGEVEVQQLCYR